METGSTLEKMVKSHWKGSNVLVTGATGLLGSWLTKRLVEQGANVIILVRDWVPKSNLIINEMINQVTVVRGRVEDFPAVLRTINEYEVDTIFHLAAQTIVGTANREPLSTFETNIKGTWVVLEAARQSKLVTRIVVASSDKAYGDQIRLPYSEETPLQGIHPYDVSKSCADLICSAYFHSYGLPVCVTRCGNFYGGGDLNFNRIIPGTILSIMRGERPIIRSNGKFIRDYIYVEDGADAYLHLAEKMKTKKIFGESFNFSYEKPMTVVQMVNSLLGTMGSKLKPKILNKASNEIIDQHLSSKKAKRLLGWKPKFNLKEGLSRTVEWYEENFNDF